MKQQPTFDGVAAAKSLYDSDKDDKTIQKVANPTENSNLFGRPSLVPGVEYPLSDREEELLDAGYQKGHDDSLRINRAGRIVEEDPFLNVLRKRLKQIRKNLVKKGRVEPVTEEEQGWLK